MAGMTAVNYVRSAINAPNEIKAGARGFQSAGTTTEKVEAGAQFVGGVSTVVLLAAAPFAPKAAAVGQKSLAPTKGTVHPWELTPTHGTTMSKTKFNLLKNDIRANGIQNPVKYVESGGRKFIVDGHHRVKAAEALGIRNIPAEQVKLPYGQYRTTQDLEYQP